jgi:putative transposase
VITFIDANRHRHSGDLKWGIESIAKTLGIAPSTYHAARNRPPSVRSIRDAELKPLIEKVYRANLSVYGAPKLGEQLNNDAVTVARCTVEAGSGPEPPLVTSRLFAPRILSSDNSERQPRTGCGSLI